MSARDGLLTIICDRSFPPGHAELRREDGSVLAVFDEGDGAEAAHAFGDLFCDADRLVVAPDLFARFSGRGTVH
jgi:hypothetical protein